MTHADAKKIYLSIKNRGHPELNQGPLDLQSNALPLSYIPFVYPYSMFNIKTIFIFR